MKRPEEISQSAFRRRGAACGHREGNYQINNDPKKLFEDEPTGELKSAFSRDVEDIFREIHKNSQRIVMITHHQKTALRGTIVLYLRDCGFVGDYCMPPYGEDDKQELGRV